MIQILPSVIQKRPIFSYFVNSGKINRLGENFLVVMGSLLKEYAHWVTHKRASPKIQMIFLARAIACGHKNAIGNGVGTLNGLPGAEFIFSNVLFKISSFT